MLFEILAKNWKYAAVLCLMLLCFAGGEYQARKGGTQTTEKTAEIDNSVATTNTQKEEKTNLKTVTVKAPDGTVTTTTTQDTDTTTSIKSKTVARETKTSSTETGLAGGGAQAKYRLGAFASRYIPDLLDKPLQRPDFGVGGGYRFLGPAWVDTTYNFSTKALSLGVSVEL